MMRRTAAAILVATAIGSVTCAGARAQGLQNESAIDAIVGSEVTEHESSAANDGGAVVTAIDRAAESAQAVRKVTEVASVEIVFLPDAAASEGGPPPEIEAKLKQREPEVAQLRQEIEGNALLYHALNSRQVLMRDVLGLEIGEDRRVVVYAAAKPAG